MALEEDLDRELMGRAAELARRAWGHTRPNPHVGAVIARNNQIIGEGWHQLAGEPHAEINALRNCRESPEGATLYVTLEPCNHHGRTPPCTQAIIAAGIRRVVVAQRDPHPQAGGGIERLRENGIEVRTGILREQALLLNPAFNTFHMLGRPLVTLKYAMTADGCTSCHTGQSAWISGTESRRRVHHLRAEHDAVLIGIATALQDQSRLTIRDAEVAPGPPPRRIVLDSALQLPLDHPLLLESQGIPTIVCSEGAPAELEQRLAQAGADVWRCPANPAGGISLPHLMKRLHAEGIQSVLLEGGRRVAGSFLQAGCVDRVSVFIAPLLAGAGDNVLSALVVQSPIEDMSQATRIHHQRIEVIPPDVLLEGWVTDHLFPSVEKNDA